MQKIFLFVLLFVVSLLKAQTLEVDAKPSYKTTPYICYTLANELNETVEQLGQRKWESTKDSFNTFQNFDKAYWAKLSIKNITSQSKIYYLKSENQFTYHIEFFLVKNFKMVDHIEDGAISKNRERVFNSNHIVFPVTLAPYEEVEVFLKIRNYNKIDINFYLQSKAYLLDFYQTYNMLEGLFFGGMLMMMFYNLFLYFLLKFRAYLYYVSYTFWLMVYFLGLFGFSQRYFSEYTGVFYISSAGFFISLTLFVQSILNLKEQLPIINKILNIFMGYFIVTTLINIVAIEMEAFFYAQILFNVCFSVIPIFVILIILSTYYLAYYKDDSIAKVYSIVWTVVSLVGLLLPLAYLDILEVDIPFDYIFQFLILFEVLCFSFILAYKIKLIEKEKEAQEKILVQQNKLASMGEMISTIAHQWRQPLSEINGIILNMDIDYNKKILSAQTFTQYLDELELTTTYMSNTINDFMNFFKHDKKLECFFVSDAIQNAIKLITLSHENSVKILYEVQEEGKIFASKSELIQALIIVIRNAIDACLNHSNEASKIVITNRQINNKTMLITISDNGGGIASEILEKIYNPYFTTKHESQGTGLGLYILKMIVEQNMKGSVTIFSSSIGTDCTLSIPLKCD